MGRLALRDQNVDSVTMILAHATHLERLILPHNASRACLAFACRNGRETLRTLLLPDRGEAHQKRDLLYINSLQNLTKLMLSGGQEDAQGWPDAGWTLPHLKSLLWVGGRDVGGRNFAGICDGCAAFLKRCQFAALQEVSITLRIWSLGAMESIATFLRSHSFVKELRLRIDTPELARLLLPLTTCSTFVAHVTFPSEGFAYLPSSVRSLGLSTDLSGAHLLSLLDTYLEGERTFEKIRIRLLSSTPASNRRFLWHAAHTTPELAMLVATLLPYVRRLRSRGTLLFDEDDQAIDIVPP
jgi:hypothetical protein